MLEFFCEKPASFWKDTRTRRREHPFGPLGLHPKLVP